jgi:hypothetical protein
VHVCLHEREREREERRERERREREEREERKSAAVDRVDELFLGQAIYVCVLGLGGGGEVRLLIARTK